ncbi:MAG: zinc ribbon domain-containing protein [Chloroflexota bacterium]|nr:zinc ribbon domain-containing protein [Chloroflexota bacterium]
MPLYEYECAGCEIRFDALREMSQADDPIACPQRGSGETYRMISLLSAIGDQGLLVAERLGVSKFTAYDMLRLLEKCVPP